MAHTRALVALYISLFCLLAENQLVQSTTDDNDVSSHVDYMSNTVSISVKRPKSKINDEFYVSNKKNEISNSIQEINSFGDDKVVNRMLQKSILKKVDKKFEERRKLRYENLAKQQQSFGSPFQGCSKSPYPLSNHKTRPIGKYEINLDAPPEDRWKEVVQHYKVQMQGLVDFLEETVGSVVMSAVDTAMIWLHHSLPSEYYRELNGISAACGISVARVTLYNVFYELFTLCTSIIMEAENGKMYHGRNLDFGMFLGWDAKNHTWFITEILRPLIVKVDFFKNHKPLYSAVTYDGYTGILTGVKKDTFSLTINERFVLSGGYVGLAEWIVGLRDASWLGLLTRRVMESAASYDQAQQLLKHTPLVAPVYFILAGNSSHQGSIVTRWRRDADIWPLGSKHEGQQGSWFLVETNFDHWKETPFYDQRRKFAVQCMDEIGREKPLETLYRVLSTRPVLNKETTLTAVMDISEGLLEVWERDCPDPCWPL